MTGRLFKSLWLIASLLLLIAYPINPVFACSGGEGDAYTLEEAIEYPILVRGTVLQVDDARFNAILQVEKYLIGQGPDQLLIYRNDPVLSVVHLERGYDTGCLYGGTVSAWSVGMNGIFALSRSNNGTYSAADSYFALIQDEVFYYRDDPTSDEPYEAIAEQLPLAEFEALIAEQSGQSATYPGNNVRTLRRRELLLTTTSGKTYLLPVDSNEALPLIVSETCVKNCITYSADGSHYARQVDANHWQFFYAYGETFEEDGMNLPVEIEGQFISFAPDGDFVLVWNNDQLILYRIVPGEYDTNGNYMNYGLTMSLLPLTTLQLELKNEPSWVIWSEDSTTFLYNDAAGIWYFDFYDTTKPWLLIPAGEATPDLVLSKTGRYVSYGTVHYQTLIDIQTGVSYKNGLISHDESRLIRFENHQLKLANPGNCVVSLSTSCPVVVQLENVQLNEAFWTGHNELLLIYCRPDNVTRCNHRKVQPVIPSQVLKLDAENLTDYHFPLIATAYEPASEVLAFVTGDAELQFSDDLERLTVTGLDSPIASISWGKALWYTARS